MNIVGKKASEIFDSIRLLTQSRQLLPGQMLPPVRDLAVALDVNRNTVASAYKRLVTAGIAVTQGRLGTVIRHQQGLGEQEGSLAGSLLVDLASGNPNPAWLPDLAVALAQRAYWPRLYGEAPVNPALNAHARKWLAGECPARFEVDLAHGAVDAIERLLAAYLVAGDKVAVENPCFLSSISTLRMTSLQAVGVMVDAQGMQADALDAVLSKGVQAVLFTPRAHNPTGCSLSKSRAKDLRRVLERYPQVLVIVDDHFALLSNAPYHDVIPASTQRWALIRSVSKVLGPDLRLAFVASDAQTSQRLRLRLASGTTWVSHLLQDVVGACFASPDVWGQIALARADYARRRAWLTAALNEQGIGVTEPSEGLNVWVPLAQDIQPVLLGLAQKGWLVRSGEAFGVNGGASGLRITVSTLDETQVRRLALDIRRSLGC